MQRIYGLLLMCVGLCSCQNNNAIQTYRVAKEGAPVVASPAAAPMPAAPVMPMLPGMAPAASPEEIAWDAPAGWMQQPPSAMRVGSFRIPGKDGRGAEVSIVPLKGMAGGDMANINRWRDQIELPPLSEQEAAAAIQLKKIGEHEFKIVDFLSEKKRVGDRYQQRIVVATLPHGERSWFFKMVGDDETVRAAKPTFLDFLTTVRLHEGHSH